MEERPRTIHGYSIYRMVIYTKLQFGRLLFKETPEAFYHDLPLHTESHCFAWLVDSLTPNKHIEDKALDILSRSLSLAHQLWLCPCPIGTWRRGGNGRAAAWWASDPVEVMVGQTYNHIGVTSRLGTPKKIHQKWLSSVGNQWFCMTFIWRYNPHQPTLGIPDRTYTHMHTMIWMIASKCQKH